MQGKVKRREIAEEKLLRARLKGVTRTWEGVEQHVNEGILEIVI